MNFFQKITSQPWLPDEDGSVAALHGHDGFAAGAPRIFLRFILAVVTVLFFLFGAATLMRMGLLDWQPIGEPSILWVNTAILILASVTFQWARVSADRGNLSATRIALLVSGVLTAGFLVGQYMAWEDLRAAGLYASSNPASAFFYMITAAHGIHMIGGLVAWIVTIMRPWTEDNLEKIQLSVGLCTTYWHYLLFVWFAMFGLFLAT